MKRLADCKGVRDMLEPGDVLMLTQETPLMVEINPPGLEHIYAAMPQAERLVRGTKIEILRKRRKPIGPWGWFQRRARVPWYYVRVAGGHQAGWVCGTTLVGQIPLA